MEQIHNKFDNDLYKFLITANTISQPIEPIITIDDSIFCIKGGLSLVTGMPKGGKTTVLRVMIETGMMSELVENYDNIGITTVNMPTQSILYFNTEMTDADMTKLRDSICRAIRVPRMPENLYIFHFLTPSPKQRLQMIEKAIEQSKNAGLVFIDGLADLVSSVNEEKECNEVVQAIQNLAVKYKVGIVSVIHENRGNKQTRGHLGQQAERKCIAAISVAKKRDKKCFEISSSMSRHSEDFDTIFYHYNENKRLERLDNSSVKVKEFAQDSENLNLAQMLFDADTEILDKELRTRMRKHFKVVEPNLLPSALNNRITRKIDMLLTSNIILPAEGKKFKIFQDRSIYQVQESSEKQVINF